MKKRINGLTFNTETAVEVNTKYDEEVHPELNITCKTVSHLYRRKDGLLFTYKKQYVFYNGDYMRTDEFIYPEFGE